jgi:two-component system sensor histidine kinase DesK
MRWGRESAEAETPLTSGAVPRSAGAQPIDTWSARLGSVAGLVWLLVLVGPFIEMTRTHHAPLQLLAALAGVVAFIAIYVGMTQRSQFRPLVYRGLFQDSIPDAANRTFWVGVALLVAIACTLTLVYGQAWLVLLIFASVRAGAAQPPSRALLLVCGLALLTVTLGLVTASGWSDMVQVMLLVVAGGLITIGHARLAVSIQALRAAQADLAQMAVAEERLRFARDLHDLLGHTLSLIALKSELAGQLVTAAPDRAVTEIHDVEAVARQALQEVREAVAGYRRPTLAHELRAAQEMLAAAGIAFTCEGGTCALRPSTEAALAWTVREGVTNVIRHSHARQCIVRITYHADEVSLEVQDDGRGSSAPAGLRSEPDPACSGLAGLSERITALGGRCEAGPRPSGGFRLRVSLAAEPSIVCPADENSATKGAAEQVAHGGL